MMHELKRRVCIVTPDFIGPIKNGGIGTHCYSLARVLVSANYDVTVLFTGPFENGAPAVFAKKYESEGFAFKAIDPMARSVFPEVGLGSFGANSRKVLDYLRNENFDLVHFQDWQGNGFHSIQSKKTGLAFEKTQLLITLHSCSQWVREGMNCWPADPINDLKTDYMEKYCAENADGVISPSHHMLNWTRGKGWNIPSTSQVVPYPYLGGAVESPSAPIDSSHVIFFGRLETRKGLEIFCKATDEYLNSDEWDGSLKRITFLGKAGIISNGEAAESFLKRYVSRWVAKGLTVEILNNLDSAGAIKFLRDSRGIAVISSLLDNYPLTIIECTENHIPFLASNVGGIPEMVSADVIFDPNPISLSRSLANRETSVAKLTSHYSSEDSNARWIELTGSAIENATRELESTNSTDPLVSICVPHYNYGKYLPQLLASIEKNDYANYEVIVVDDGSSDPFSRGVFKDLEKQFSGSKWHFIMKANEGIGATRNFAAAKAKGEYLIFMDADNLATPKMISRFVKGMQRSGADCLTCHYSAFISDEPPPPGNPHPYSAYLPIGPCKALGVLENVFGDANFVVKASVFNEIGGFSTDRGISWEDWEFLAKLTLKGFVQDVVPDYLFYYRDQPAGISRNTSLRSNHLRILRPYLQYTDLNLLNPQELIVPMYYQMHGSFSFRALIKHKLQNYPILKSKLKLVLHKFRTLRAYILKAFNSLKKLELAHD